MADALVATQLPRMGIPENLAGIVEHYVARLSSDERAVLQAAAVCGVDFRAGHGRGGPRPRRHVGCNRMRPPGTRSALAARARR